VKGVAEDCPNLPWWGLFERDFKTILPKLRINFLSDFVSVAAQPMIDEEVHVSNVKLSAI
jgi:hypothetical protein